MARDELQVPIEQPAGKYIDIRCLEMHFTPPPLMDSAGERVKLADGRPAFQNDEAILGTINIHVDIGDIDANGDFQKIRDKVLSVKLPGLTGKDYTGATLDVRGHVLRNSGAQGQAVYDMIMQIKDAARKFWIKKNGLDTLIKPQA